MVISESLGTVENHHPLGFNFESIDRRVCSEMCCTSASLSLRISAETDADCEKFYLLEPLEAYDKTLLKTVHERIVSQFLQFSV